ncbi:helicase associated domain-containing protein [Streptomyces sp. IB201691-2A2]|uniref:helicase associated domain-containing protein n=1 Tax=Streptomyces sp. IB201691-2A2 TaxID=2561920 RepID=UPI0021B116E5|nr:helicase associated domain-containing protein [Streptomyces sp. IB201691-2A2]
MKADGGLPVGPGAVIVQGDDLRAWITGQRAGWDRLMPAQQYLLETLGIEPAAEDETLGPVRRSQDERWNTNLAAVRKFRDREGHVRVPRKAIETVDGVPYKIGAFLDNTRRHAGKLSAEQRAELAGLGFEWTVAGG